MALIIRDKTVISGTPPAESMFKKIENVFMKFMTFKRDDGCISVDRVNDKTKLISKPTIMDAQPKDEPKSLPHAFDRVRDDGTSVCKRSVAGGKLFSYATKKQVHPSNPKASGKSSSIPALTQHDIRNIYFDKSLSLHPSNHEEMDFSVYMKCFIHELRTPISTISLGLNVLKDGETNKEKLQTIRDISKSIVFIEQIFTKFAIIQDGNIVLNSYEPFSINKLIASVEVLILYNFKESNVKFEYMIEPNVADWNYGDSHNIKHVIINLLKNAIKYREISRENTINIYIKQIQNHLNQQLISIHICDTNNHLLPHIKEHLFESFNSTSGSGMGLFICKKIIELHGGTIHHEFIEPIGNEFIVEIPLSVCRDTSLYINTPVSNQNIAGTFQRTLSISNKKYNLLIADDSTLNVKMMYKLIEKYEIFHHIYTAEDGLEVIKKMEDSNIDVIFIDKHMPNMNGIETVKLLRKNNFNKLIFGVTGEFSTNYEDFIESGADYIIQKPFTKAKMNLIISFIQKNGTIRQKDKKIMLIENIRARDSYKDNQSSQRDRFVVSNKISSSIRRKSVIGRSQNGTQTVFYKEDRIQDDVTTTRRRNVAGRNDVLDVTEQRSEHNRAITEGNSNPSTSELRWV